MISTFPETYQLSSRIILRQIGRQHIAIVKLIKSRIIQKDAVKIVTMARQIQSVSPSLQVSLICTKNICSKSLALLADEQVEVIYEE